AVLGGAEVFERPADRALGNADSGDELRDRHPGILLEQVAHLIDGRRLAVGRVTPIPGLPVEQETPRGADRQVTIAVLEEMKPAVAVADALQPNDDLGAAQIRARAEQFVHRKFRANRRLAAM